MLNLGGAGILALWNGVEATRRGEYDAWHTREHVGERITVPGMLGARRYRRLDGPLPEYLTLYAMDDVGVLQSDAYRRLLETPTDWSASMRPSFRGFMRLCGRRLNSFGGGMGSVLAAVTVDDAVDLRAPALGAELAALCGEPAITAAHIVVRDPAVPEVPFTIGGPPLAFPRAGAILLESYDAEALARAIPGTVAALCRAGIAGSERTLTSYGLSFALDQDSLDRVVPVRRQ